MVVAGERELTLPLGDLHRCACSTPCAALLGILLLDKLSDPFVGVFHRTHGNRSTTSWRRNASYNDPTVFAYS